jgi:hypothetical protein
MPVLVDSSADLCLVCSSTFGQAVRFLNALLDSRVSGEKLLW